MGFSLYEELNLTRQQQQRVESGLLWVNVPAFVAVNEDPEFMHRIKCIIPVMNSDENPDEVHDEWIDYSGPYAGSAGYGDISIPAIGSEVLLTGEFGQGERLFYLCRYNENSVMPGDSDDESKRLISAPCDLTIKCGGTMTLQAGDFVVEGRYGTGQISATSGLIFQPEDEAGGA